MLVTIDTLRADRIGAYGNANVATPNMDRLAQQGAMALHTSAHVPLTRPSHVSLFTGLYPSEHGIRDNVSPPLGKNVPVLAEILQQSGFRTAAFVSSIVLAKQSGLNRGFQTYEDAFEIGEDDARFLNTIQKRGDKTVEEAVAWLRAPGADRRFAWVHLYDPHDPYEPPEPYASRYADRLYDGEVAWSDELVGRLDTALGAAGLRDDTLLVVTSDHGEGLDEHGEAVHGFFVYETTLHVPLVARGPGIPAGAKLDAVTRTIDLMPTLLDLLGLASNTPKLSGRSLASGAARRRARRRADVRRVARAARALRLERSARAAPRVVEVHPGAAPRAVRSRTRSRRAAEPDRAAAGAGEIAALRPRAAAEAGTDGAA